MTTTTTLELLKPELTDPADITILNQNWDKLDNSLSTYDTRLTSLSNTAGIASYINGSPSEGWCWRRWSNGIAECWYSRQVTVPVDAQYGSIYAAYGNISSVAYPLIFTNKPCETVCLTSASDVVWLAAARVNTNAASGSYTLCSAKSIASQTYIINYHVIGKWTENS